MQNYITKIKDFFSKRKAIFIIVILILIGGVYWYIQTHKPEIVTTIPLRPTPEMNKEPESPTAYAQVDSLNTMSTSDELGAIEADLESTNLDSLTREFNAIEAELGNTR